MNNTIFSNLFVNINKLLVGPRWSYKYVPDMLVNWVAGLETGALYYSFPIDDSISVYMVMNGDDNRADTRFIMLENKLAILCVVPSDILQKDVSIVVRIIFQIYKFILNYIDTGIYGGRVPTLFSYAAEILAMNTLLNSFKLEYNEMPFISQPMAEKFIKYSVNELLDNGLVFMI